VFAGYYTFNRAAGGELNKDLQVGEEIFPVGAGYYTEFDYSVVPIFYGYSFINTEKHELTGILGLHWSTIDFNITGYLSAGSNVKTGEASTKASAPLPLIGFAYEYRFSDRWTAGVMAQAFYLELSDNTFDYSGSVLIRAKDRILVFQQCRSRSSTELL